MLVLLLVLVAGGLAVVVLLLESAGEVKCQGAFEPPVAP